ncbi:MAG TPA: bifunctional UDP-N-acetylglucosamine diphosphorylase/glucosamine-1-phosphate N-acetyltransferase GlmU [Pararhizobium sp.]|nr:bifunctional UDP-N-acetylglucosamine diphosphorylase/glucosamine-1-phosphate N-acetyltransferase GlmU [Pararhizobium sp.]
MKRSGLAIILAAGAGTRMKSATPKVLHPVAGRSMLGHVMAAAASAEIDATALVVGHGGEAVLSAARAEDAAVEVFEQTERLGTAHAVLAARTAIRRGHDDILVLFADTPLVTADTLARARAALASGADIAVIGFRTDDPSGYGRLIEAGGELIAIREEKDATAEERTISFCNGGLMAIAGDKALSLLESVGNANAKGEYSLTDIVEIARVRGGHALAIEADAEELIGVNTRAELAEAEALWQRRRRRQLMLDGVTMIAPETVFLSFDTEIAADTMIEPNVFFGRGVTVEEGAIIHAFCHFEEATIGRGAEVGPFARLRPGARLAARAKVGNFCEVKKADVGEGAKINHLSYIGDAVIGPKVNVGAGTITCNYDGVNKHLTEIGTGTFIGSNTSLVAPIRVGENAYVASGSVITDAVPDDALAFGRARQVNKEGRAAVVRDRNEAFKAAKAKK